MLLGLAYHPSTSYQEVITLPLLYRDLGGIEYRKVKSDGMHMTGQKFQTLLGRAGPKGTGMGPLGIHAKARRNRSLCFQISVLMSLLQADTSGMSSLLCVHCN